MKVTGIGQAHRALATVVIGALMLLPSFGTERSVQAQDVAQAAQATPLDSGAMQQLVAPIALYPDALIAQSLAASTYPDLESW